MSLGAVSKWHQSDTKCVQSAINFVLHIYYRSKNIVVGIVPFQWLSVYAVCTIEIHLCHAAKIPSRYNIICNSKLFIASKLVNNSDCDTITGHTTYVWILRVRQSLASTTCATLCKFFYCCSICMCRSFGRLPINRQKRRHFRIPHSSFIHPTAVGTVTSQITLLAVENGSRTVSSLILSLKRNSKFIQF